jgi:hypothetical protein
LALPLLPESRAVLQPYLCLPALIPERAQPVLVAVVWQKTSGMPEKQ